MELKPCPKGLLRTIAYTQLSDAIKKDFGIELPRQTGNEIPKVIDDILGVRSTDPLIEELAEKVADHYCKDELLKEMAEALEWISEDGHAMASMTIGSKQRLIKILQKYHEQEAANAK